MMKLRNAFIGLLALALTLPVMAGVAGEGDGVLNKQTVNITNRDSVTTQITEEIILSHIADIVGIGVARGGGQYATFRREASVSEPDTAAAIAEITALLKSDVFSVPGRTAQFSSGSSFQGTDTQVVNSTVDTVKTGENVVTSSETSVTQEPGTLVIGDLDDPCNVTVVTGQLNVITTNTTNITEFFDEITTNEVNKVDCWRVCVTRIISPLVLDLDGDGKLEASGGKWLPHKRLARERMAFFDLNGNGFPVLTEWVGSNDGLLCLPKEDGTIDGTCLFGTVTGFNDGYEALSVLDKDNNRKIEGAELDGLMVWQDKNVNAHPDAGEVVPVQDLKITSIGVNHKKFVSSYVIDGETRRMFDWWPNIMELNKFDAKKYQASR